MDSPKALDRSAAHIVEYLKTHPEFFSDNPDVLESLFVPHMAGPGVASLIECQVMRLRERCVELQHDLDQRKDRASHQRATLQGVQAITLKLLQSEDLQSVYSIMFRYLKRDYGADELRIFVFSDTRHSPGTMNAIKFMERTAKLKYLFIELLNRNKPLCGSLQDEHIRLLFQGAAGHVNSTLIVPVRKPDWEGLIAVGSHERGRYSRGFDLDMLQHLFAVTGIRIDQLIKPATA